MSPRSFAITLLSAPLLALAQNAFKIPEAGLSATGGQPVDLQWDPTTDGTVTLVLRSGSSNNLNEGTVIASKSTLSNSIENDGSYTWTPSNDLTRGSDYTVQIVSDEDPSVVNYTPYFVLDTDTTVAKSTSEVSLGATSAAPDLSTASPTGSATSVLDSTATSDSESTSATTTDDSSSQTTSMPSSGTSSGNMMMTSSGMTMMTGTSSMTTGTSTNSDASTTATSSDASSTESSSAAASTSVANLNDENGAGALKISGAALAGLVAAVALGAFAL